MVGNNVLLPSGYSLEQDIHLVQRRRSDGNGNEFIWKIDQRWVKGKRDPNTVVYKINPRIIVI